MKVVPAILAMSAIFIVGVFCKEFTEESVKNCKKDCQAGEPWYVFKGTYTRMCYKICCNRNYNITNCANDCIPKFGHWTSTTARTTLYCYDQYEDLTYDKKQWWGTECSEQTYNSI